MRLRPTLRASHLSWGGLATVAVGLLSVEPAMVGYGAAILSGIAMSRALTLMSVARARSAGFEMLWRESDSLRRATKGHSVELVAELRNRDSLPTYFRKLAVTHAPGLRVSCSPDSGEVPAGGSLQVRLRVTPLRVGYHGIFTLTLQTIRAPGLFTVPLAFSNPFVLEVLPQRVRLGLAGAVGGRSAQLSHQSTRGARRGEGMQMRELREHMPGDPYKRIAWKASGRRGKLLVIEREQEERDTVWVLMDASVDAASGPIGDTAMDRGIDLALHYLDAHLTRGDEVGLALVGARVLKKIQPNRGPKHVAELVSALSLTTHTADADRSDWDASDVAARVLEHASAIDRDIAHIPVSQHELLASHARRILPRAPTLADAPLSPLRSDRVLRQYLVSFGIQPPPRSTSDRHHTERQLAATLLELQKQRPRPSLVYVIGRPPTFETPPQLLEALRRMSRSRITVRFVPVLDLPSHTLATPAEAPQPNEEPANKSVREELVEQALEHRQQLAAERGIAELTRLGVRVERRRSRKSAS